MTEEKKEEDLKFFEELKLEDFQEYEDLFKVVQKYKQKKIDKAALKDALFGLRFRQLKDQDMDKIINETSFTDKDGDFSIFNCLIFLKKMIDAGTKEKFRRIVRSDGVGLFRTPDPSKYKHKSRPYWDKEANRYAKMINKILKDDPDCKGRVPIDPDTDDLFNKLKDGVILGKLINKAEPGTIKDGDIKTGDNLSPQDKFNNVKKALDGAKKMGCKSNCTPDDVADGHKPEDEDLLGEILARINCPKQEIMKNPNSSQLLNKGETVKDLANLPVDDFLKRWFNHHLTKAGHPNKLNNFGDDLKDSEKYTVLLNDLDPKKCDKSALNEKDPTKKANKVIDNAKKYGAETLAKADDITSGDEGLNRLLASDIYNAELNGAGDGDGNDDDYDKVEMRAYIMTMNKLLANDDDCKGKIPINPDTEEVFDKLKDGVVLSKLVGIADPNAINEDNIKKGDNLSNDDKKNNLDKVLDGAKKLGCKSPAKPNDVLAGKKRKVKDLVGEILGKINAPMSLIKNDLDCDDLVQKGEKKDDLGKLSPDDFLKRWFNKHLANAGHPKKVNNFGDDCKDGEKFAVVLNDIDPTNCDKSCLNEKDPVKRAAKILDDAKKLGVDTAIKPESLAAGDEGVNRLFAGQIYNAYANPYCVNEKECYVKMINKLLKNDPEFKGKIPIDPKTNDIFRIMKDGNILAKLINLTVPGTIDERALYKGKGTTNEMKKANLNLVLNAAKSLGCQVDCTADDILNEIRALDVDLLYQILKPVVFNKVKIQEYPQLLRLKEGDEANEEMLTLGPEDLLMRWFNHHLTKAGHPKKLTNFGEDVVDSEKYTVLLNQLDPKKCDKSPMNEADMFKRAGKILTFGKNIGADVNILPEDIPSGNEHLNTIFTAELFGANCGMGAATNEEKMAANKIFDDDAEGGREERCFRTWINSLKIKDQKKCNNLYEECRSAILLLKIIDKIKPGTVDWKKVELHTKNPIKIGVNCDECIKACKKSNYSIVGIGGSDIREGNKKYILAIVWQLMRAHTLKVTGEKPEEELVKWGNSKVSDAQKIGSLKDKSLNTAVYWIEILAAIEPKCVRWDLVVKEKPSDKDREMNAKYALSVARGIGCCLFIVWEDVTEVKSRLLLTFLAALYDVAKSKGKL